MVTVGVPNIDNTRCLIIISRSTYLIESIDRAEGKTVSKYFNVFFINPFVTPAVERWILTEVISSGGTTPNVCRARKS